MRKLTQCALPMTLSILAVAGLKAAADLPVNLSFAAVTGDGIRSDNRTVTVNGSSVDYANGSENVLAIIQSAGNFRFSTRDNTRKPNIRTACVDFGTQFSDAGMLVPFADGTPRQCVDMLEAMLGYATGNVSIQQLRYGQAVQKLVRFTWTDGGYYYRLGYGSDMDQDGTLDSAPVSVTCIAPANANLACSKWVLSPQGTEGNTALFRYRILKTGEGPAERIGTFSLPFAQTFTRQ
jgi:hypothetical protein